MDEHQSSRRPRRTAASARRSSCRRSSAGPSGTLSATGAGAPRGEGAVDDRDDLVLAQARVRGRGANGRRPDTPRATESRGRRHSKSALLDPPRSSVRRPGPARTLSYSSPLGPRYCKSHGSGSAAAHRRRLLQPGDAQAEPLKAGGVHGAIASVGVGLPVCADSSRAAHASRRRSRMISSAARPGLSA